MLVEHDPVVVAQPPRPRGPRPRRSWPAHWPLTVTMIGFPLWWALGLRTVVPMLMGVVMADQLMRRRRLVIPRGFTLWVLFMCWLMLGAFVLFADAPGAQPGGGASRILVFGYRLAWYFTASIVLVWIANMKERELPTKWLYQLLAYMFVVTVVGGLAGVLVPHLEFTSPFEMLLPHGLRSNGLVQSIAHPAVADIQNVLGHPEARPKAPFPFANSWGSSLSLYLPFFVVAWFRQGPRWQRYAAPVVLVVALVPIIYSLNRGLWISLVLGVVGALLLLMRSGRVVPIVAAFTLLIVGLSIFALSPLGTIFQERLAHQHSNDRRGELLTRTVTSALEGSPVVGFGSTRQVQGGFSSIATADTPDCSACGVPPLGTQGHLWGVIFGEGYFGAAFFVGFFVFALWRSIRCRTIAESLCSFVLIFFLFQLLVYDTLGMPLVTVMISIGLVAREQRLTSNTRLEPLLAPAMARVKACGPYLLALMLLGAAAGAFVGSREPVDHATSVSILLEEPPVYLSTTGQSATDSTAGAVTIDTEAALVIARQSLARVVHTQDPQTLEDLRQRIRVTAAPNTSVLTIEVRNHDAAKSREQATSLARSYLLTRKVYLSHRRAQTLEVIREQLATLHGQSASAPVLDENGTSAGATRDRLDKAVSDIALTPTSAGEVIRTTNTVRLLGRDEVPMTTGAALGLFVGALLMIALPGWRPAPIRLRRRKSRQPR